uniref:Uncharacterized protein n=1 Tax=Brassica campestris TaxID=3711 RepID=A0A3P5YZ81_BRACM|nr:unnamed protein product [Brassica rapa]
MSQQKSQMDYWDAQWRGYKRNASSFCETHPFLINSQGVWEILGNKAQGMSFWEYPLPNLEIIIFSTFVIWRLFDFTCSKIGLRVPRFTYMMIAGVILGQTCYVNNKSWLHNIFFPDDGRPKVAETLGAFGFLLYWFLKGVTMEAGTGLRMGKKAGVIGFTTMFAPLICGNFLFRWRKRGNISVLITEYRLIIFMQSISAFTSIDTLLKDLKIKHSEFGRIALAGSMVTDMLAFIITFLNAMHYEKYDGLLQTVFSCLFFAFMVFVMRPAMYWVIKQTPEGRPVKDFYIYLILALACLSFKYFVAIHSYGPAGSFVFGLSVPNGYPLGSAFVQKFESFNLGALFPLFGSLTMMQVDVPWLLKECGNLIRMEGQLYEVVSFILFVNATKFTASTIAAYSFKMPLRDSFALALVLNNKGVFELAYFAYAVETKVQSMPEVFTIVAAIILLNSIFIPMALELVHDPSKRFKSYRKRNLAILKDGAELQSLVCIYKPDNITSMISLLEAFNPSKDSPMACNVLHLIALVGQATPTFISHQLQKPELGSISCSDNVITSFRRFQQKIYQYTSLDIFTSVSMTKHMHEDICWLALSKSMTLILLPFHRTWSVDRSTVISNDDKLRIININVLRRAPCSVGIFIYRKPIVEYHMTAYHSKICLIFNGGKDDKEALAITNRLRLTDTRISLTIIRFTPTFSEMKNEGMEEAFQMVSLEETVSNFVKEKDESVTYIDKAISDGSETSKILRAMGNDYDLFIVGRSSGLGTEATSGLSEWTEFEELGPIGDLLASHEFPSRASVLVVKKQEYIHHTKSQKRRSKRCM